MNSLYFVDFRHNSWFLNDFFYDLLSSNDFLDDALNRNDFFNYGLHLFDLISEIRNLFDDFSDFGVDYNFLLSSDDLFDSNVFGFNGDYFFNDLGNLDDFLYGFSHRNHFFNNLLDWNWHFDWYDYLPFNLHYLRNFDVIMN